MNIAAATDAYFANLRAREFGRLDQHGLAYLDYTGSALYGTSQLRVHQRILEDGIFGNPHSENSASRASTAIIERARELVLRFLDVTAATHAVCFTANATAAIHLVAASYPFTSKQALVLSADNHNSMNGIREYARRAGARVRYLGLDEQLRLDRPEEALEASGHDVRGGLLGFPAQSNFSGVRHPLSLVNSAHRLGLDVLLDAAAFLPTAQLSLRNCPADFVVLSFYKLFGYPTGLGALVARHNALARLRRPWFAGGTVTFASVTLDAHELRPSAAAFEDGTPDFLSLAALDSGFRLLDEAGMERIGRHVSELTRRFLDGLRQLRHADGTPLARVYGPPGVTDRGGTVTFNLCDRRGRPIAFGIVEERARHAGVALRGGCFCNPGASEAAFGYGPGTLLRCLGTGFSLDRFAACVGPEKAVGAVRVSPGLATGPEDISRALDVLASFRENAL